MHRPHRTPFRELPSFIAGNDCGPENPAACSRTGCRSGRRLQLLGFHVEVVKRDGTRDGVQPVPGALLMYWDFSSPADNPGGKKTRGPRQLRNPESKTGAQTVIEQFWGAKVANRFSCHTTRSGAPVSHSKNARYDPDEARKPRHRSSNSAG